MQKYRKLVDEIIQHSIINNSKNKRVNLDKVSKIVADKCLKNTGIDISKLNVYIDSSCITHIVKNHGINSNSVLNGGLETTLDDILEIKSHLRFAEKVYIDKKSKRGNNAILLERIFKGKIRVVLEVLISNDSKLLVTSIYKINGSLDV
jgi:phage-Barnase-EndoU-ColicinE5/D-RelE like nuclease3